MRTLSGRQGQCLVAACLWLVVASGCEGGDDSSVESDAGEDASMPDGGDPGLEPSKSQPDEDFLAAEPAAAIDQIDRVKVQSEPDQESASTMVDDSGGRVEIAGLAFEVPAGALDGPTTITISETDQPPPLAGEPLSPIYRCAPTGIEFNEPVTVRFRIDGTPTDDIAVLWSGHDGAPTEELRGKIEDGYYVVQITHCSLGTLLNLGISGYQLYEKINELMEEKCYDPKGCCPGGSYACANSNGCCQHGYSCFGADQCLQCPLGSILREDGRCWPYACAGLALCGDNCCPSGAWCGGGACKKCPDGYSRCGDDGCCPGGTMCSEGRYCITMVVDHCATNNGGCDARTTCTSTADGRSCGACPRGYSGTGESGCADVNECLTNNGGCDARTTCTNTAGGRYCGACPSGYTGSGETGCTTVAKPNPCDSNNGGCDARTTCTNNNGTAVCGTCPSGYTGTASTGCVDIDECQTNNGGCGDAARWSCTNRAGVAPTCTTRLSGRRVFITSETYASNLGGVSGANAACQRAADDSELGGAWRAWISDMNGSSPSATFSRSEGPYTLLDGTVIANSWADLTDGTLAHAIDVYDDGMDVTSSEGVFTGTGTDGAAYPSGGNLCANWTFTGAASAGRYGVNGISDAASGYWTFRGTHWCDQRYRLYCFEEPCALGPNGNGCTDANECHWQNGGCDALSTCTNTASGRTCGACPAGHTGTGETGCVDVNECATNNGGCDPLTACTNRPGGNECGQCPSGYAGTGSTGCVDIDECLTDNGGCGNPAQWMCTNNVGEAPACTRVLSERRVFVTSASYSTNLGGVVGADDKCQAAADARVLGGRWKAWVSDSQGHSPSESLTPAEGPYRLLDGTVIARDWADLTDGTLTHSIDVYDDGSKALTAQSVFTGTAVDGTSYASGGNLCANWTWSGAGQAGVYGVNGVTDATGGYWTFRGTHWCNETFHLYCFEEPCGYGPGEAACIENHCRPDNGGCDAMTTCTNTTNGRTCGACPSGYSGSGETDCVDLNECSTNNGGCNALTTCTNTPGGRTCGACPSGYSGNGETGCVDLNECSTNNGGCNALTTCTNTPGGRTCGACPSGYSGNGETGCVDLNECSTNNGNCGPVASWLCVNNVGAAPTCTMKLPSRRVFVTSATFGANFGGVSAGNTACQTAANARSLGGTWKAWLSDRNGNSPSVNLTHSDGPYVLLNGTVIADNWADLTDGTLDNPVNVYEDSTVAQGTQNVFTGTDTNGTALTSGGNLCSDWTWNGAAQAGWYGVNGVTDSTGGYWTFRGTHWCSETFHLYCFEEQ